MTVAEMMQYFQASEELIRYRRQMTNVGVDVSSGVKDDSGTQDEDKLRLFIAGVQRA